MPKSIAQTFRVPSAPQDLILAFRDEALYRRFHDSVGDRNLSVAPFTSRGGAEERTSQWVFPTPSAIRTFAGGAKTTSVREVTRITSAGNTTVFVSHVAFGGCKLFEQISAKSEVVVKSEGEHCCVTVRISCVFKGSCFFDVEGGTMKSLQAACQKWVACAARATPQYAAARRQREATATAAAEASDTVPPAECRTTRLRALNRELCLAQEALLSCTRAERRNANTPERRRVDELQHRIGVLHHGEQETAAARPNSSEQNEEIPQKARDKMARMEAERKLMQSPKNAPAAQTRAVAPTRRRPTTNQALRASNRPPTSSLDHGLRICAGVVNEVVRSHPVACEIRALTTAQQPKKRRAKKETARRHAQQPTRHLGLGAVLAC